MSKRQGAVTFREKVVGTCHQKLVRDRAADDPAVAALFPAPPNGARLKSVRVRQTSRHVAWKIISRFEWLGTLPPCSMYFGAFFDSMYCGGIACIQTTTGAGPQVSRWLGVPKGSVGYLVRGACVHWAPTGTAPKLINYTGKLLADRGFQVMLAYSDTEAGEIGTVYQAAGWHCLGYGSWVYEYVSPQGRVLNCMVENQIRKKHGCTRKEAEQALLRAGWRKQRSNPKLRYIKVLEPGRNNLALRRRIEVDSVPYPKRDARSPVEGSLLPGEAKAGQIRPDRSTQG